MILAHSRTVQKLGRRPWEQVCRSTKMNILQFCLLFSPGVLMRPATLDVRSPNLNAFTERFLSSI